MNYVAWSIMACEIGFWERHD